MQRSHPFGKPVRHRQAGVDQQAMAVLHQPMPNEARLRLLAWQSLASGSVVEAWMSFERFWPRSPRWHCAMVDQFPRALSRHPGHPPQASERQQSKRSTVHGVVLPKNAPPHAHVAVSSGSAFSKGRSSGRMRPILVTGGAGFIGAHTCKDLAAHGFLPIAFDNLSRGHRDAVQWGPFVQGDILNQDDLDHAFEQYRPKAVIHFAGLAYVGESVDRPLAYYRNNVSGLINVLDVMVRHGADTIVKRMQ